MKNDPLTKKQKIKFQELLRDVSLWSDESGFKRADAQSILNTRGAEYVRTDLKHLVDDAIRLGYLIPQSEKPPVIMLNISNNNNFGLEMHVRVRFSPSGENLLEWDPSWWGQFKLWFREDSAKTAAEMLKTGTKDTWKYLVGALAALLFARFFHR